MKTKYTGPRPHITQHGVTFKEGKDDKYVYLNLAIQILKAIDKDFGEQKAYSYDVNAKRLSDNEIINFLKKYEINLESDVAKEQKSYEQKLDEEIELVQRRENLTNDEKETWIKNLEIMREYRIQRAINKIVYIHIIKDIANIVKREKITELKTPFFEKFWHTLRSIHGELLGLKSPIKSELKLESKEGEMSARLIIENY